jgi:hypothetical protein
MILNQAMADGGKIAVMQPYFFPYIGYFQLINLVDTFVFFDDVNFINRGWINRNNILLNGKAHRVTVPLAHASQNRLINKIAIAPESKWKTKLLKTIKSAYARAPYYRAVFPRIESWIHGEHAGIAEMNKFTIKCVCDCIGMNTRFVNSSAVYDNYKLEAQHRVLDICLRENARIYVNPVGGMALYDHHTFKQNGIDLVFLRANQKPYPQGGAGYISNLSILDCMMFLPLDEIADRLQDFTLLTNA